MKYKVYSITILLAVFTNTFYAAAQNTEFTYQGHVTDNGTNFNGVGQFQFALVISTNANLQATATITMGGTSPHKFINAITLANHGSGYASAPNVTFSGGGGSGAQATTTISGGVVTAITLINPGSGYSSAPTVTIDPPPANITYTTYWSNDGTSVAGSEPSSIVSVAVSNGLFTVVLGDPTLPNMASIGSALFSQPNLQLRIWFNDGVSGFAALSPVQNLTPAPYAVSAVFANSASNLVSGLIIQQNAYGAPNVIEGASVNSVANGVVGATIGGGGYTGANRGNTVTADFGTVSGGDHNMATNNGATIGGGGGNLAGGFASTIGGGSDNIASGNSATVPGGYGNQAVGDDSFAAGDIAQALHQGAFVWADSQGLPFASTANDQFLVRAAGGVGINTASPQSDLSVNGGLTVDQGSSDNGVINNKSLRFGSGAGEGIGSVRVSGMADSYGLNFYTDFVKRLTILQNGDVGIGTTNPTFAFEVASNGVAKMTLDSSGNLECAGTVYSKGQALTSDRNLKENFQPVNYQAVLAKVVSLPVTEWNYKSDDKEVQHIGPMAQDFQAAFQLDGKDDKHISVVDEGGVALAAIQGLNQKLQTELNRQDAENVRLKQELAELKQMVLNLADKKH